MNRPNKDYYTKYWVKENEQYVLRGLKRYQEDLEKYCDELERALDKAGFYLEWKVINTFYQDNGKDIVINKKPYKTKEQWKEWLMNND